MRRVVMDLPTHAKGGERLARLTRHWKARLEDFGPGGPEVLSANQKTGEVCAKFQDHQMDLLLAEWKRMGVQAALQGENAVFFLTEELSFEDLDYAWGCLFELW